MSHITESAGDFQNIDPLIVKGATHVDVCATWGQEYMWDTLNVLGPLGAHLNICVKCRMPNAVTRREVLHSIQRVIGRHNSLRTRFIGDRIGSIKQRVDRLQAVQVRVLEAPESTLEDALEKLAEDLTSAPFNLERDPLVRIGIVEQRGCPVGLVLACSHMVLDGWSIALLSKEIDLITSGEKLSSSAGSQPIDQSLFELSPEGVGRGAAALKYWAESLEAFPAYLAGDDKGYPISPRYNHGLLRSGVAFDEARYIATSIRVTLPAVVIGILALVIGRVCGISECPLLMEVSNRIRPTSRDIVGHFPQSVPLLIDVSGRDVGIFFTDVQRSIMKAVSFGQYPPAGLRDLLGQLEASRGYSIPLRLGVNYVPTRNRLSRPEEGASRLSKESRPESSFTWLPSSDRGNVAAQVNVWEGSQEIALHADSMFMPMSQIEPTLRQVESTVLAIAKEIREMRGFSTPV